MTELVEFLVEDDESPVITSKICKNPWKILIVDDEDEVHKVTMLVLKHFEFEGRGIQFFHAYNAAKARELFCAHKDIAVAFIDVVMENEHAGLALVRDVRDKMKNAFTRLILRTGQPGQAPEAEAIQNFDIDDYRCKSELTDIRLKTALYSALRSYRDLMRLVNSRERLQYLVNLTPAILKHESSQDYIKTSFNNLHTLLSIIDKQNTVSSAQVSGFVVRYTEQQGHIIEATTPYQRWVGKPVGDWSFLGESVRRLVEKCQNEESCQWNPYELATYFEETADKSYLIYLRTPTPFDNETLNFIDIVVNHTRLGFKNHSLTEEIEATQNELVHLLSESIESRSAETGNHVKRVAEISKILGLAYGLSEEEAERLRLASPLHDLGKIGIPDSILHKKGKLTSEEKMLMRQHVTIGYRMLRRSKRFILKAAAIIAHEHHERWDGQGYPRQLKENEIHPFGRITAIADVLDALTHRRSYKNAWTFDEAIAYLESEKGRHFDPVLVNTVKANKNSILEVFERFEDGKCH